MPSRPPSPDGERRTGDDAVVRRVPLAMTVALEVVAELRARDRATRVAREAEAGDRGQRPR
ncbi:MAG: hypothetical protein KF850_20355 [Labilithrix sp.]|nr:hypothetical protein [Labilithrix sp.]